VRATKRSEKVQASRLFVMGIDALTEFKDELDKAEIRLRFNFVEQVLALQVE
jgi:hypothetical protein